MFTTMSRVRFEYFPSVPFLDKRGPVAEHAFLVPDIQIVLFEYGDFFLYCLADALHVAAIHNPRLVFRRDPLIERVVGVLSQQYRRYEGAAQRAEDVKFECR